jgi:hypothetical protein
MTHTKGKSMSNERFITVRVYGEYGDPIPAVLDRQARLVAPWLNQTSTDWFNEDPEARLKQSTAYWEKLSVYPLVDPEPASEPERVEWADVMLSALADKIRAAVIECHPGLYRDEGAWLRLAESAVAQARREGALP